MRKAREDLLKQAAKRSITYLATLEQRKVAPYQILVSFGDGETPRRLIAALQEEETCWVGGTLWHGQPAMRLSVSSWATTEAHVERSLEVILQLAVILTKT